MAYLRQNIRFYMFVNVSQIVDQHLAENWQTWWNFNCVSDLLPKFAKPCGIFWSTSCQQHFNIVVDNIIEILFSNVHSVSLPNFSKFYETWTYLSFGQEEETVTCRRQASRRCRDSLRVFEEILQLARTHAVDIAVSWRVAWLGSLVHQKRMHFRVQYSVYHPTPHPPRITFERFKIKTK